MGRCEFFLEEGLDGGLQLPPPYGGEAQLCVAGPGVGAAALCAPLAAPPSVAHSGGGYNAGLFWHQNVAWGAAIEAVAQWVEVEDRERGRELREWASPLCHAAVAHYFASGIPRGELQETMERRARAAQGAP